MWDKLLILAPVLGTLTALFYWAFIYSNRMAQTGYTGRLVKQTLYTAEYQKRVAEVDAQWAKGKYHVEVINDKEWYDKHLWPELSEGYEDVINDAKRQLKQKGRIDNLRPGGVRPAPPGSMSRRSQMLRKEKRSNIC